MRARPHERVTLIMVGFFTTEATINKSSVPNIQGGPVRFGYGLGLEQFKRFRFSGPAVPLQKGLSVFQYSLTGKDGSGSWKTVPAVPVPLSISGKTVPTVLASGSGSVPEPPCNISTLAFLIRPEKRKNIPKCPFGIPKMNFPEFPGSAFLLALL